MRIGLLSAGSRRWIAGSLYLHNIIRALHLLTDTEDVALELFARAGSGVDEAAELGDYAPRRHVIKRVDRSKGLPVQRLSPVTAVVLPPTRAARSSKRR